MDWNVLCDPVVTKLVLKAYVRELIIFPCDVTYHLTSIPAFLEEHVHSQYHKLFDGYSDHDSMTVTYPFHLALGKLKRGTMRVDLHSVAT